MSPNAFDVYQRARFMRPDARRWIRPDIDRFLKPGSSVADIHPASLKRKYSPDQPRDHHGRWTNGDSPDGALNTQFSPDQPGWHDYENENLVCPADLFCSAEEIADQLARFSVPGNSALMPVEDNATYHVFIPGTDIYVGDIRTNIVDEGLTIINRTLPGHIFFDGEVTRSAQQTDDGAWHVTTRGIGNNVEPGMSVVNQLFGPDIFNGLDRQMRANIEQHHGRKGFAVSTPASGAIMAAGRRVGMGDVFMGKPAHG